MVEPNFQAIIVANVLGLALLASLFVSSYMTRERRHLDDRIFTVLIIVCAGACIFEPVSWFVDGHGESWAVVLSYVSNTYCFLGSCLCPYVWVLYADIRLNKGADRISSLHPVAFVPTVVLLVLNIGNLFGHYMFYFDENHVYHRLPLSYVNYVLMFALCFYSVWLKMKFQREHGRVRFFPVSMFLIPIFVGAGLQAAMYGVSVAWPSVCIGLASIHMSMQNELSYVDPLTNLYNRAYLDGVLRTHARSHDSFGGIMIDLDFFKEINDRNGHSVGDDALVQTARLLTEAAPSGASVMRYAGDEFVMLVNNADEAEMLETERAIEKKVADFNEAGKMPYKLSLSMGHGVFEGDEDAIDEFLSLIDERMYAQKRRHHGVR